MNEKTTDARSENHASGGPGGKIAAREMNPLYELTLSRVREFMREPEAVFWVFIFPVLLALALGIAFRNRPPEKSRVAVDGSVTGAAGIVDMLSKNPNLEPVMLTTAEAARQLRTGKIDLTVSRPQDHDSNIAAPSFTFNYDPTRPQSRLARMVADDALQRGLGRKDIAAVKENIAAESGARYIDFLIPGLIGLNLMGSGMWGIGFNVVNARTRKLLKLFIATPMRKSHYLASFIISRMIALVFEVIALIGFGWIVFGVKIHGSMASLAFVSLLGSLTFAGLGLLVASRARSIEAVSGWMNFAMLPMWLLSGSFFPYSRFPEITHPFIRALPLTALNDVLRAIINDGTTLLASWPEICVLAAWSLLSYLIALKIFRWQ